MRQKTIHELREKELKVLVSLNPELGAPHARKLMNSFYRLCGLSWSNFEYDNDGSRYNEKQSQLNNERESRWCNRLNKEFKAYDLSLKYCGIMPSIGTESENGAFTEVIKRYFYD